MNKNLVFWITAWPAIAMTGCATLQPPRPPRLEPEKACADWQWIGIRRCGVPVPCPPIQGWKVRPLFPPPAEPPPEDSCTPSGSERGDFRAAREPGKELDPDLKRELSRFCVYEVEDKRRPPQAPPASADLVRLDRDCAALSISGPTEPGVESAAASSQDFMAEAGLPVKPFTIDNPYGVRLAFLDTQPTAEYIPEWQGNSPHGFALAYIGQNLVCEDEGCAARITTRLALPILEFNAKHPKRTRRDEDRGGYLGMQSDLAAAITKEVDDWQRDRRGSSEQHLVLNLSLAWDGELFGGLGEAQISEMKAGTQAVYRALEYAAGFDALVLAAAGNAKTEPCSNFGPLLPAAWEMHSVRDESCREHRRPLLYAVGGLRAGGFALGNARPGGMPRRAAYAVNGMARCPLASGYTAKLTGTSVSTAVVSSIAAVVWAAFPEKSSCEIMDMLDESGEPLSMPADFWFGEDASPAAAHPWVHSLSLCTVLEQVCGRRGAACRPPGRCVPPRRASSALPPLSDPSAWPREACQPWVGPQPGDPPCPMCPPY